MGRLPLRSALLVSLLTLSLSASALSEYVLGNGQDIRIVSLSPHCHEGRVEFFNGSAWGTLSDCTHSFGDGKSVCKTLGWDDSFEKWIGAAAYNARSGFAANLSANGVTAYTLLSNCSAFPYDTCSDCTLTRNMDSCRADAPPLDVHDAFDVFLRCKNYGDDPFQNAKYECTPYDGDSESSGGLTACASTATAHRDADNSVAVALLTVAILGSICAVIAFAIYSKCQETKRLSLLTGQRRKSNYRNYVRKSGFSTVPQGSLELQMGAMRNTADPIPVPQAMFIYQTRRAQHERNGDGGMGGFRGYEDHDDEQNLTVDHSPGAVGGYDMEQIIPNVIYSTNNSASESYGLIKNEDDDDEEEPLDQHRDSAVPICVMDDALGIATDDAQ